MAKADISIDWPGTGLVPSTDLVAWHMARLGESESDIAYDQSGHNRDLIAAATAPVFTADLWRGQPGWVFDGSAKPLTYAEAGIAIKYAIIFAAAQETTFTVNRGLLSGVTSGNVLATKNDSSNDFYNFYPSSDVEYRKSAALFAEATMDAPTGLVPELIEWRRPTGVVMDGIQIGQQLADTARKWKGWFFESILYSEEPSATDLLRLRFYFNVKYGTWAQGVPFRFPDATFMPQITGREIIKNREEEIPKSWPDVWDTFKYDDGFADFNSVGDDAAKRWEYVYVNVPKEQKRALDAFWDQAQIGNPFYFKDKYDVLWSDVRVESYDRGRESRNVWSTVTFNLIGYGSTPVIDDATAPTAPVITGTSSTSSTITVTWSPSSDSGVVFGLPPVEAGDLGADYLIDE
jgi:hypothetical protein